VADTVLPALECTDLVVAYGATRVLDVDHLRVDAGSSVSVLGPSGSGKTSLLHAVAGFIDPANGRIAIAGRPVTVAGRRSVPPEQRDVGVVFQHYALWPHLDAADIVAYPLRRRGMAAGEARDRAAALLDRLGVGDLTHRRPAELSGGQQQRVGLARALAGRSSLYLFDEPTAHLDTPLRASVQRAVSELRRASGAAVVTATHDAGEALALSDRVVLLRDGRVVQTGTPADVYECPVDLWAARLTGPASLVRAVWQGEGTVHVDGAPLRVGRAAPGAPTRGPVGLLVRPDWVTLDGDLSAVVADLWYRGTHTDVLLDSAVGDVVVRLAGRASVRAGARVGWGIRGGRALPIAPPPR
jgi:ABC-type Fe3+/spermidine/putrescine transport system ATPase subunit